MRTVWFTTIFCLAALAVMVASSRSIDNTRMKILSRKATTLPHEEMDIYSVMGKSPIISGSNGIPNSLPYLDHTEVSHRTHDDMRFLEHKEEAHLRVRQNPLGCDLPAQAPPSCMTDTTPCSLAEAKEMEIRHQAARDEEERIRKHLQAECLHRTINEHMQQINNLEFLAGEIRSKYNQLLHKKQLIRLALISAEANLQKLNEKDRAEIHALEIADAAAAKEQVTVHIAAEDAQKKEREAQFERDKKAAEIMQEESKKSIDNLKVEVAEQKVKRKEMDAANAEKQKLEQEKSHIASEASESSVSEKSSSSQSQSASSSSSSSSSDSGMVPPKIVDELSAPDGRQIATPATTDERVEADTTEGRRSKENSAEKKSKEQQGTKITIRIHKEGGARESSESSKERSSSASKESSSKESSSKESSSKESSSKESSSKESSSKESSSKESSSKESSSKESSSKESSASASSSSSSSSSSESSKESSSRESSNSASSAAESSKSMLSSLQSSAS